MDNLQITSIYGKTFDCACGKTHHIDPQGVIYAPDAIAQLPDVASTWTAGRRAVLLMDARTRAVAGAAATTALQDRGWNVSEVVVPDSTPVGPVCDDETFAWLQLQLRPQMQGVDIVIPVGSGVLSDLGKWLAFDWDVPYVAFGTAASMNGYASANVAATVKGVKTLIRARAPRIVLSDPNVIRDAPYEMTAAGLGDILAKSVSSADWRMNHILFGDYFCDRSVSLIAKIEPLYLDHPDDVRQRKPQALEALFHALLLTGVAMTMAETSSPASGGEHLVSHTLDMMSSLDGVPHDLHGRQVGVGTVLASALYRRIIGLESPDFSRAEAVITQGIDEEFWGSLSGEVASHYAQKIARMREAVSILSRGDAWDRLREEMASYVRSPEQIRHCLRQADAAYRAQDIGCSRERLLQAVEHAHEIRSRFTIIDLARLVGLLPQTAAELVEVWAL